MTLGEQIYSDFKSLLGWILIIGICLGGLGLIILFWEQTKPFVILGVIIWLISLYREGK